MGYIQCMQETSIGYTWRRHLFATYRRDFDLLATYEETSIGYIRHIRHIRRLLLPTYEGDIYWLEMEETSIAWLHMDETYIDYICKRLWSIGYICRRHLTQFTPCVIEVFNIAHHTMCN